MAKKGSFCTGENLTDVEAYFEKSNKLKTSPIFLLGKKIVKKLKILNF